MVKILLEMGAGQFMAVEGRIFGLDTQLIADVLIQGLSIFILFLLLSYILFEPVKKILKNREDKIKNDIETARTDKEEAAKLKTDYDGKIKEISQEKTEILSEARKKAQKREHAIIEEANVEADKILTRANQEIILEKSKVVDEMRSEIIRVATAMASQIIGKEIDESKQDVLIEETLKEMSESTWLSK